MLYWPDFPVEKFHIMEVDGDIHTIEGRGGDDTFMMVLEGNTEPVRVHIDKITQMVRDADEVVLKKR